MTAVRFEWVSLPEGKPGHWVKHWFLRINGVDQTGNLTHVGKRKWVWKPNTAAPKVLIWTRHRPGLKEAQEYIEKEVMAGILERELQKETE